MATLNDEECHLPKQGSYYLGGDFGVSGERWSGSFRSPSSVVHPPQQKLQGIASLDEVSGVASRGKQVDQSTSHQRGLSNSSTPVGVVIGGGGGGGWTSSTTDDAHGITEASPNSLTTRASLARSSGGGGDGGIPEVRWPEPHPQTSRVDSRGSVCSSGKSSTHSFHAVTTVAAPADYLPGSNSGPGQASVRLWRPIDLSFPVLQARSLPTTTRAGQQIATPRVGAPFLRRVIVPSVLPGIQQQPQQMQQNLNNSGGGDASGTFHSRTKERCSSRGNADKNSGEVKFNEQQWKSPPDILIASMLGANRAVPSPDSAILPLTPLGFSAVANAPDERGREVCAALKEGNISRTSRSDSVSSACNSTSSAAVDPGWLWCTLLERGDKDADATLLCKEIEPTASPLDPAISDVATPRVLYRAATRGLFVASEEALSPSQHHPQSDTARAEDPVLLTYFADFMPPLLFESVLEGEERQRAGGNSDPLWTEAAEGFRRRYHHSFLTSDDASVRGYHSPSPTAINAGRHHAEEHCGGNAGRQEPPPPLEQQQQEHQEQSSREIVASPSSKLTYANSLAVMYGKSNAYSPPDGSYHSSSSSSSFFGVRAGSLLHMLLGDEAAPPTIAAGAVPFKKGIQTSITDGCRDGEEDDDDDDKRNATGKTEAGQTKDLHFENERSSLMAWMIANNYTFDASDLCLGPSPLPLLRNLPHYEKQRRRQVAQDSTREKPPEEVAKTRITLTARPVGLLLPSMPALWYAGADDSHAARTAAYPGGSKEASFHSRLPPVFWKILRKRAQGAGVWTLSLSSSDTTTRRLLEQCEEPPSKESQQHALPRPPPQRRDGAPRERHRPSPFHLQARHLHYGFLSSMAAAPTARCAVAIQVVQNKFLRQLPVRSRARRAEMAELASLPLSSMSAVMPLLEVVEEQYYFPLPALPKQRATGLRRPQADVMAVSLSTEFGAAGQTRTTSPTSKRQRSNSSSSSSSSSGSPKRVTGNAKMKSVLLTDVNNTCADGASYHYPSRQQQSLREAAHLKEIIENPTNFDEKVVLDSSCSELRSSTVADMAQAVCRGSNVAAMLLYSARDTAEEQKRGEHPRQPSPRPRSASPRRSTRITAAPQPWLALLSTFLNALFNSLCVSTEACGPHTASVMVSVVLLKRDTCKDLLRRTTRALEAVVLSSPLVCPHVEGVTLTPVRTASAALSLMKQACQCLSSDDLARGTLVATLYVKRQVIDSISSELSDVLVSSFFCMSTPVDVAMQLATLTPPCSAMTISSVAGVATATVPMDAVFADEDKVAQQRHMLPLLPITTHLLRHTLHSSALVVCFTVATAGLTNHEMESILATRRALEPDCDTIGFARRAIAAEDKAAALSSSLSGYQEERKGCPSSAASREAEERAAGVRATMAGTAAALDKLTRQIEVAEAKAEASRSCWKHRRLLLNSQRRQLQKVRQQERQTERERAEKLKEKEATEKRAEAGDCQRKEEGEGKDKVNCKAFAPSAGASCIFTPEEEEQQRLREERKANAEQEEAEDQRDPIFVRFQKDKITVRRVRGLLRFAKRAFNDCQAVLLSRVGELPRMYAESKLAYLGENNITTVMIPQNPDQTAPLSFLQAADAGRFAKTGKDTKPVWIPLASATSRTTRRLQQQPEAQEPAMMQRLSIFTISPVRKLRPALRTWKALTPPVNLFAGAYACPAGGVQPLMHYSDPCLRAAMRLFAFEAEEAARAAKCKRGTQKYSLPSPPLLRHLDKEKEGIEPTGMGEALSANIDGAPWQAMQSVVFLDYNTDGYEADRASSRMNDLHAPAPSSISPCIYATGENTVVARVGTGGGASRLRLFPVSEVVCLSSHPHHYIAAAATGRVTNFSPIGSKRSAVLEEALGVFLTGRNVNIMALVGPGPVAAPPGNSSPQHASTRNGAAAAASLTGSTALNENSLSIAPSATVAATSVTRMTRSCVWASLRDMVETFMKGGGGAGKRNESRSGGGGSVPSTHSTATLYVSITQVLSQQSVRDFLREAEQEQQQQQQKRQQGRVIPSPPPIKGGANANKADGDLHSDAAGTAGGKEGPSSSSSTGATASSILPCRAAWTPAGPIVAGAQYVQLASVTSYLALVRYVHTALLREAAARKESSAAEAADATTLKALEREDVLSSTAPGARKPNLVVSFLLLQRRQGPTTTISTSVTTSAHPESGDDVLFSSLTLTLSADPLFFSFASAGEFVPSTHIQNVLRPSYCARTVFLTDVDGTAMGGSGALPFLCSQQRVLRAAQVEPLGAPLRPHFSCPWSMPALVRYLRSSASALLREVALSAAAAETLGCSELVRGAVAASAAGASSSVVAEEGACMMTAPQRRFLFPRSAVKASPEVIADAWRQVERMYDVVSYLIGSSPCDSSPFTSNSSAARGSLACGAWASHGGRGSQTAQWCSPHALASDGVIVYDVCDPPM